MSPPMPKVKPPICPQCKRPLQRKTRHVSVRCDTPVTRRAWMTGSSTDNARLENGVWVGGAPVSGWVLSVREGYRGKQVGLWDGWTFKASCGPFCTKDCAAEWAMDRNPCPKNITY